MPDTIIQLVRKVRFHDVENLDYCCSNEHPGKNVDRTIKNNQVEIFSISRGTSLREHFISKDGLK